MFRIRRFEREDLTAIMRLVRKTLGENYDPSIYLSLYEQWPKGFIVAERGKRVIGFALGALTTRRRARLLMLAVHPSFRRRGVGSALIDAFFREAAVRGAETVVLEVRISNKDAIRFYQRHGFRITGILDRYYSSGESAYTMQKVLSGKLPEYSDMM